MVRGGYRFVGQVKELQSDLEAFEKKEVIKEFFGKRKKPPVLTTQTTLKMCIRHAINPIN